MNRGNWIKLPLRNGTSSRRRGIAPLIALSALLLAQAAGAQAAETVKKKPKPISGPSSAPGSSESANGSSSSNASSSASASETGSAPDSTANIPAGDRFENTGSSRKRNYRPSSTRNERDRRWSASLVGGTALVSPTALQEILSDTKSIRPSFNVGLGLGYRTAPRARVGVRLGYEFLSRDTSTSSPIDTDQDFRGKYSVRGFPVFALFSFDILEKDLGVNSFDPTSRRTARFAISVAAGPGMMLATKVSGSNDFGEKISTKSFNLYGAEATVNAGWVSQATPIGFMLGLGYRFYQSATLGSSGKSLNLSAPIIQLGASLHF